MENKTGSNRSGRDRRGGEIEMITRKARVPHPPFDKIVGKKTDKKDKKDKK